MTFLWSVIKIHRGYSSIVECILETLLWSELLYKSSVLYYNVMYNYYGTYTLIQNNMIVHNQSPLLLWYHLLMLAYTVSLENNSYHPHHIIVMYKSKYGHFLRINLSTCVVTQQCICTTNTVLRHSVITRKLHRSAETSITQQTTL